MTRYFYLSAYRMYANSATDVAKSLRGRRDRRMVRTCLLICRRCRSPLITSVAFARWTRREVPKRRLRQKRGEICENALSRDAIVASKFHWSKIIVRVKFSEVLQSRINSKTERDTMKYANTVEKLSRHAIALIFHWLKREARKYEHRKF